MTSSYAKGDQYEKEVKEYLEEQGWTVFRQHRKAMFLAPGRVKMVGADFFGCDIVAKKYGEKTLWVQVSTLANKSSKIKQVSVHPWNPDVDDIQIWLRHDGKKKYSVFAGLDWGLLHEVDLGKKARVHPQNQVGEGVPEGVRDLHSKAPKGRHKRVRGQKPDASPAS